MIDLDITVYDMFDLPPLSEYEVYIKNFGSDNTQQVRRTLWQLANLPANTSLQS